MDEQNAGKKQAENERPDIVTQQKNNLYDKLLERVPLTTKKLDVIIALLFVLLIAVAVVGYVKGNC